MPAGKGAGAAARRRRAKTPMPKAAGSVERGTDAGATARGLLEMQRSRLLVAATGVIAEHGCIAASVATICTRAGVSRRTFYEIFDNREHCMVAILRGLESRMESEIGDAIATKKAWRERVRAGLATILGLLDREPGLATVCLLESQRGERLMLAERNRMLARLARAIDAGAREGVEPDDVGPLTAEALVGACIAVLQARLAPAESTPSIAPSRSAPASRQEAEHGAMRELLGDLTALIVLPYEGAAAARRERRRPAPVDLCIAAVQAEESQTAARGALGGLSIRLTYRTAAVLRAVVELEGEGLSPSNRKIADRAGVRDQGQISKLLARLQYHELLVNAAKGAEARGEANSWSLTSRGRQVLHDIGLEVDEIQRSAA
ncbi:MAG TPA: TetR/AcrR family transcriptional regulator [Solirubrobacteraceae bacterium]|jgi:AcrR family transcriptional regulator